MEQPRLKILLAEDHPVNQKVIALILEAFEVDLTIVDDGAQAVQSWSDGNFDLILMDMLMPVMDGIAAIREIRRIETQSGAQRTAIALLTANAQDHARLALDAGSDHYIAKPVTVERLASEVEQTLSLAASRSSIT